MGAARGQSALDGLEPNVDGPVYAIAVEADGNIIFGGEFTSPGGTARASVARPNVDGSLDTEFNPGANITVDCKTVDADGKILVGGDFTELNDLPRMRIGRLSAPGTTDAIFSH